MIQVQFMKPFYTKLSGTKLRLVFAYQYFSITKDEEIFHFIPIEGKEMIVDLNTMQVENLSEVFVFQRGNRFVRLPLYQLLSGSNIHEHLMPLIENVKNEDSAHGIEELEEVTLIAKVNFKGFGESRARYKTYYFKTNLNDLKSGDIVFVDSLGEKQKANFLGYVDKGSINIEPTKYILEKLESNLKESNIKINRHELEYKNVRTISKETKMLFHEIEEFHKAQYIDKCLDDRDFEAIKKVI